MSNTYYGGIPIEQVDFDKEYETELIQLKEQIKSLEERKKSKGAKFNSRYWTIKLNRANKALQESQITLD